LSFVTDVSHSQAQGIEAVSFCPFWAVGQKIQAESPVRRLRRMRPNKMYFIESKLAFPKTEVLGKPLFSNLK
jgi:hypothetical protein